MNLIFFIVLVFCFYKIRFYGKSFNKEYLTRTTTNCINGVFVFFVFFRHFAQYMQAGPYDKIFTYVNGHLRQYIVVTFLFYSGYGIMSSIRKKGRSYINSIIYPRGVKVWLHFALAVLLFHFANQLRHSQYSLSKLLLSLVGWESIGNSNWYVFCVLIMYAATFLAFILTEKCRSKRRELLSVILIVLSCVLYVLILRPFRGEYWFDTAIAYPLGMLYFLYEDKIRRIVQKNNITYIAACAVMLILFHIAYRHLAIFVVHELSVIWFMALILLFTMKFSINNKVLTWLGKYTFEIYILQRIPMMLLRDRFSHVTLYFSVCFVITLVMAVLFRKLTDLIDARLFARKN